VPGFDRREDEEEEGEDELDPESADRDRPSDPCALRLADRRDEGADGDERGEDGQHEPDHGIPFAFSGLFSYTASVLTGRGRGNARPYRFWAPGGTTVGKRSRFPA
jgi:hypothetical protein